MSDLKLEKISWLDPRTSPVLVVVLDGVGIGRRDASDAVHLARTPTLDHLSDVALYAELKAHGVAVGMPSDADMGNSEVGHNALGAGRIFDQGAKLVENAMRSGEVFKGDAWRESVERCRAPGRTLHFLGLLSDGNVHSHIDHLITMIEQADRDGLQRVRVHVLTDGRDVGERTALSYIARLESTLSAVNEGDDRDYRVASGGGRMLVTMDRYNADWSVVERGWRAHVQGDARAFASAAEAIEALYEETGANDQNLPAFVIADDSGPVGKMQDGDAAILFNFRGDRAIEITRAFDDEDFDAFDRGERPDVLYAGMMQYDGDLKLPRRFLVAPPHIDRTMGEYLASSGLRQLAISETQKFGHVTYFWNGNRSGKFDDALETYIEIPSDNVDFSERPWMKAAEITDATLEQLRSGGFDFARINYPNGDMVGHTGGLEAAIIAIEITDLCLGRLMKGIEAMGGTMIVTADHGNADQMFYYNGDEIRRDEAGRGVPMTSHTLNRVPCWIHDPQRQGRYELNATADAPSLANIAATALNLMGYAAPEGYAESLIKPSGER